VHEREFAQGRLVVGAADTHERVMRDLDEQWEAHAMRAHVISRMMDSLAAREVHISPAYAARCALPAEAEALPWSLVAAHAARAAEVAEAAKYRPLMQRKKEGMRLAHGQDVAGVVHRIGSVLRI
jgi:hypothetical protein